MPLPVHSEQDILPFALDTARRFGDPNPTLIQHVATTTETAGAVFGSHGHDDSPVYLVAIKGQFSMPKPTRGATTSKTIITRPVLLSVLDPETGNVVISGSRSTYPDLADVGPVVTDLNSGEDAPATPAQ
jgi:hypothetical protein